LSSNVDFISNYTYCQSSFRSNYCGTLHTQPIGVKRATINDVAPTAYANKLNGNQNDLTITITEFYSNGMANVITETIKIDNNEAGTFEVGGYKVFVDTKGNDQIRACYIVE
jgi:hypothetical protein